MSAAKYNTSTGIEGEFQPGSGGRVLKNRLGIRSKQAMDEAEFAALVEAQERYLEIVTDETVFTAETLRRMHLDWLGRIYEWAGSYRTVELSKAGFTWPPAFRVSDNMTAFEENLLKKATPFRLRSIDESCHELAMIHAELLLIHPFREGNGRIARWLTDLMCLQAGLPQLDYAFVGRGSRKRQAAYLQAVIQGYDRNYRPLAGVFRDALERATSR